MYKNKIIITVVLIAGIIIGVMIIPKMQFSFSSAGKMYSEHNNLVIQIKEQDTKIKELAKELEKETNFKTELVAKKQIIENEILDISKLDQPFIKSTPKEDAEFLEDMEKDFLEGFTDEEKKELDKLGIATIEDYKKELNLLNK